MDSFIIELVSNASSELFPDNTLSSFTNFLPDQVNLEGQWEVAISEFSYPSMYQNVTDGNFLFYDAICTKTTTAYYLEPGLYSSVPDIVEALNLLIKRETITMKIALLLKYLVAQKKLNFHALVTTLA